MARYKAGLETRDRILEAVRAVLAGEGLEGTTIKAICHRAGIQVGSFYNLFDSKETAIFAVVRQAIDAVDPDPGHVGVDTVASLVDAYVRFITEQQYLARIYIRIGVGAGLGGGRSAEIFLAHHRRRVERFADAMARRRPALAGEEARARAELMLAALNGLAVQWLLDPSTDLAGLTARLVAAGRSAGR